MSECDYLKGTFFKLGYPDKLVDATVTSFLNSVFVEKDQVQKNNAMSEGNIVLVIIPSKIRDLRTSTENSSTILATTSAIQYKRYSGVQKLASSFKFRRGNHPSLAGNVLYINLNVICEIQIISATLLARHLHKEPPLLGHM